MNLRGLVSRALVTVYTALIAIAHVSVSAAQNTGSLELCERALAGAVSGFSYDYLRLNELMERVEIRSQFVRRGSTDAARFCPEPPGNTAQIRLSPARLQSSWSQGYPLDRNNGALWAGRGAAFAITAGAEIRLGKLSLALSPTFAFQQNQDFDIKPIDVPGYTNLINAGHPQTIDLPQRFGHDPFTTIDPGQSYVRVDSRIASFGISHENIWIGPSLRTPLLLSNTAAGFPHLFVSVAPFRTPVGRVAVDAFWGRLDESDYFDGDETNDHRLLTGLTVELEPRGVPGLFVGAGRLYTTTMSGRGVLELIARPYGLSDQDQLRQIQDNTLFALFARYVLPKAGAEVWAEWGHENGFGGLWDLLSEPDQTQAYVLGLQKVTPVRGRQLVIYAELAHLESPLPLRSGRGAVSFYTHGAIRQGHTHKGQMLGAWIGPGSDAQMIATDWIGDRSSTGLYLERARFDTDAYLDQWANFYGHNGHDAQLAFGFRHNRQLGQFQFGLDASYAKRYNRSFLRLDGTQSVEFVNENNVRLDLELIWRPRSGRPPTR